MIPANVTFLSDYGLDDEFVGVCKSVVYSIAPDARIVDLTHDIPSFDVRSASLSLVRAAEYLLPGVVIAAVDPGAATQRRLVAVELGAGESVLVGPDNGLLAPVTAMSGGATRAFELTNDKYWLTDVPTAFAGRDVLAPVAAHLCNGVQLQELGREIDASTLVPGLVPFSGSKDETLHADIVWIDRYGNAQLNVAPSQLDGFGEVIVVTHGSTTTAVPRVKAYADAAAGKLALIDDANGLVALVVNERSAAEHFQMKPGDAVTLRPASK